MIKNPPACAGRCKRHRFSLWVRKIPWSREWLSTAVLLPGELHGQRGLVGYSPWGHKETLGMTCVYSVMPRAAAGTTQMARVTSEG